MSVPRLTGTWLNLMSGQGQEERAGCLDTWSDKLKGLESRLCTEALEMGDAEGGGGPTRSG